MDLISYKEKRIENVEESIIKIFKRSNSKEELLKKDKVLNCIDNSEIKIYVRS